MRRCAEGHAGIIGGRLNKDVLERGLGLDTPVDYGIQRHASGKTQIPLTRVRCQGPEDREHEMFRVLLEARGNIHVDLPGLYVGRALGYPEQLCHSCGWPGHFRQVEIPCVEPEARHFSPGDQHQQPFKLPLETWLPVSRQRHHRAGFLRPGES